MTKQPDKNTILFKNEDWPLFESSLSHKFIIKTLPLFHGDPSSNCSQLEINLMKCANTYGQKRYFEKCSNEIDDYHECQNGDIQYKRYLAMKEERERQQRPYMPVETDYIYTKGRL